MSNEVLKREWAKGFDKVKAKQAELARSKGFIHLAGGSKDLVTSRYMPLALSLVALPLVARGCFNMYTGRGKIE
ncbi:acytochrome-C oxidase electron carrier [Micractinium conductrix]|uniref:Acytochrome-C oxidase electron carrier n=1 Tax=Micractinium conductrix TaxID=554055 RepID=A0A2P6VG89_9CHLO|nr:acytochrome-C oxidase electron carrier [Micractinium conductrix]|eukprot:PSC73106.1 acytochrome-C oxidase electron carrier [Micractinium conductrix]